MVRVPVDGLNPKVWESVPVLSSITIHTVPVQKQNLFMSVSKTSKPFSAADKEFTKAGAVLCAVLKRGTNRPWFPEGDLKSKTDRGLGVSVPIPTWACA